MDKRVLVALALAAFACGGKAPRAPVPRAPAPPPPADRPVATAPSAAAMDALAPEPRIRVGLVTAVPLVRLTSARPLRVGGASLWLETQDVLVQPERDLAAAVEGAIYRVELGSFPTEAAASDFRARAAEEIEDNLSTARVALTGRYAVRAGTFETEAGAAESLRELERRGFDGASVVREPTFSNRATGFLLIGAGAPPLRVASQELRAAAPAGALIELDGKPYRGYLEIELNGSGSLTVTNVVNLEDYLMGVVPAELSPDAFPEKEALKAQAVAARTYAVKRLGQFASEGYDICATPACQVYRGYAAERPLSNAAVAETAGEVLTFDGKMVDALYTSTCGGRTENAENVFSQKEPYLVSRACALESRAPVLVSSGDASTLDAAILHGMGVRGEFDASGPASASEARLWLDGTLRALGETPCWREPEESNGKALDILVFAELLGEGLCWERRLPFLISSFDAERIVGPEIPEEDRVRLAYALRSGLVAPDGKGIRQGEPLAREDVLRTLGRLVADRGEPALKEGRVESLDAGRITLRESAPGKDESEVSMAVAPSISLFREISRSSQFASRLTILPNDRVKYRSSDDGIDLLVLLEDGGSFDRSSRFSHWLIRKSAEDLSREVNASLDRDVGPVVDLRPKRYGASGRIAELEVVGRDGTATLRGLAIRRALGIRENLFFFDRQAAADGTARGWVFTGRGWGHGVGMCQVGAYGMAASGFSYRDILSHYYPGTRIDFRSTRP